MSLFEILISAANSTKINEHFMYDGKTICIFFDSYLMIPLTDWCKSCSIMPFIDNNFYLRFVFFFSAHSFFSYLPISEFDGTQFGIFYVAFSYACTDFYAFRPLWNSTKSHISTSAINNKLNRIMCVCLVLSIDLCPGCLLPLLVFIAY